MARDYTRSEIISVLDATIKSEELSSLYNEDCLNYYGETTDTEEAYSDIIAEWLLEHDIKGLLGRIESISRHDYGKEYFHERAGSDDNTPLDEKRRKEEHFAQRLLNEELGHIGKIITYQVPIKGKRSDKAGKIDLLAYNENEKLLSLVELKWKESKETMLRAILEICTYYCQIDKGQLKEELEEKGICPTISGIQKVILIFKESPLYEHYREKTKSIQKLAAELEVQILVMDDADSKTISKE